MRSCCCLCMSARECVSHPTVARQRLGKNPLIVTRQRFCKTPLIVSRQRLGRNVTAVTNTHAAIEKLSRLLPEDGDRMQSPKRHVLIKNIMIDNVQKLNHCINIPPSRTFRSYLREFTLLLGKGRAIAQAVSGRLPTAAARVRSQVRSCGICGGQSGTEAGFLRVLRFPLPILIPPTTAHSSPIIRGWYNRPNIGRHTKWTQSHPTPRN
jgi:hypothetical protein